MKKLLFIICFCFTTALASAQDLAHAERLYKDQDFASAEKRYQQALETTQGDDLYQAQLRYAACQFNQGKYLTAAKTIMGFPLPKDNLWKVRFLLYRIHMEREAANQYLRILPTQEIIGERDVEKWTLAQWNEQIEKEYEVLWILRNSIVNEPIGKESLILSLKETDTQRIPTLFDFVVNDWVEWLTRTDLPLPEATSRAYLSATATPLVKYKNRVQKLMGILKTAYQTQGTNRENARIFWRTDYLLFPFDHPNFFEIKDYSRAIQVATLQLNILSGFNPDTDWWQKMKTRLSSAEPADYGKSYAAYRAALLLQNPIHGPTTLQSIKEEDLQDLAGAVTMCQYAVNKLAASHYTQRCEQLIHQITAPQIAFLDKEKPLDPQKPQIQVHTRNIPLVHTRLYPLTQQDLEQFYRQDNRNVLMHWDDLLTLTNKTVKTLLESSKSYRTSQTPVTYKKEYFDADTTLNLPALEKGFYAILVSADSQFNIAQNPVSAILVNSTDLALFSTAAIEDDPEPYVWTLDSTPSVRSPSLFHFYTVNLKTGEVEPTVNLSIFQRGTETKRLDVITNHEGIAHVSVPLQIDNKQPWWAEVSPLATKDGNTAVGESVYINGIVQQPVQFFAQTDRAIYRPGQNVFLSVQAFQHTPRGVHVLTSPSVQVKVYGANEKIIYQTSVSLNEFGTAQLQFTLPENKDNLLGVYRVKVSSQIQGQTFEASHSFQVEEYKRPEYEISLDNPSGILAYGQKAHARGTANYYTGNPLQRAVVKYTISRQPYLPPFYWWRKLEPTVAKSIAQGETKTDENGSFEITWTPELDGDSTGFTQYVVEAEVADPTGRPITARRSYKVGSYSQLFKVEFTQGFYDEKTAGPLAQITLTNTDGNPVTGEVMVHIYQVEDKPDTSAQTRFGEQGDLLNLWYKDARATATVLTQTIPFRQPGAQTLQLPSLPEGIYRLTLQNKYAEKQNIIFVVSAAKSSLNLPAIALAQHATYYPGQTARFLLGARQLSGSKRVEVYYHQNFLRTSEKLPNGLGIYELPVTQQDRGGLAINWFGASNYQFHHASTVLTVPFDNQELAVHVDVPKALEPGQQALWTLTVNDSEQNPVNAQASVAVYDKALDYYATVKEPFTLASLFTQTAVPVSVGTNTMSSMPTTLWEQKNTLPSPIPLLPLPSLNLGNPRQSRMARLGFATEESLLYSNQVDGLATAGLVSAAAPKSLDTTQGTTESVDLKKLSDQIDPGIIRSNFSETAYFNAVLPVPNGVAQIDFTFPQSLTQWNVHGFALTKDAQYGDFAASVITRKEFMAKLHLPRFYREEDKGVLQVSLTNFSEEAITVPVSLDIKQNDEDQLAAFGITNPVQSITIRPNSVAYATWQITAPQAPGLYEVTTVARYGEKTDAEQRTLPVFPSRSRLLASAHAVLHNGTNAIYVSEPSETPDSQVQIAALRITPNLALSVLYAMPNLLLTPNNDIISSVNRYVPLAIIHTFYEKEPLLKEAVQRLPRRDTVTPPWNTDDPLRLTLLEQTPWTQITKETSLENMLSLLDSKNIAPNLEKQLENILKFQNENGSFSWFAGGPEDTYLTLRVLESFAQAATFKAPVPQEAIEKAIAYVIPKIQEQETKDESSVAISYLLYAAYTLSSFPQQWQQVAAARPHIEQWASLADHQSGFLTPLQQVYAAAIYHRLGDDDKANDYLDKVLFRMMEDPLSGAYFTPEDQGWLWYQDTLTKHTLTLKTLLEMRPGSDKIDPMVQWLLFNRQVASWDDPVAVAQAVSTLLEVMRIKGVFPSSSKYQLSWDGEIQKRTFKPLDWTSDLQWIKPASELPEGPIMVMIDKDGNFEDFASLNVVYTSAQTNQSPAGVINITREYFVRSTQNNTPKLRPLKEADQIRVGEEIEVQLHITAKSAFDYVLVSDPKPAGFESPLLTSGWEQVPVPMYREAREESTNFYINHLPAGKVTLRYTLRSTSSGRFRATPAQVQSLYAPQFGAHSASAITQVVK